MNKTKTNLLILIFLILSLATVYFFYACQIKTYWFSYKTDNLKEEVYGLGCYNSSEITQELFDSKCESLISEHNNLTKEWNELPCVDNKISALEEIDNNIVFVDLK